MATPTPSVGPTHIDPWLSPLASSSSSSVPTGSGNGGNIFAQPNTATWIALGVLFIMLCIISATSVTVTRYHFLRRHRLGQPTTMNDVIGVGSAWDVPIILGSERIDPEQVSPGRKRRRKAMKKPILWDLYPGSLDEEVDGKGDGVWNWQDVMPIAAHVDRIPKPSSRNHHSSTFRNIFNRYWFVPRSSSETETPSLSSPQLPISEPNESEVRLTVAIAMPVNLNSTTHGTMPDYAIGTATVSSSCQGSSLLQLVKPNSNRKSLSSDETKDDINEGRPHIQNMARDMEVNFIMEASLYHF
ncbi:hypothetical protein C8Q75DRAFT_782107 [Abortiporus biennis]|nr:hypothetical protein C8Q75DRAFT_782107 [Abortiporus biennis]